MAPRKLPEGSLESLTDLVSLGFDARVGACSDSNNIVTYSVNGLRL